MDATRIANKNNFAKELNELITRYLNAGSEPQENIDELTREANLVFARYNLEIYIAARESKSP